MYKYIIDIFDRACVLTEELLYGRMRTRQAAPDATLGAVVWRNHVKNTSMGLFHHHNWAHF